jgi:uncharacterized integral membrane protein
MIRKLVTALILVPLAIVFISFAVANRHAVVVSFDPFDAARPALAITLPLFALILVLIIGGVVLGGAAAWMRQRKWRARARRFEAEARRLRAENERLQRRTRGPDHLAASLPAVAAPRLTMPPS